ncbi:MAG TPA: 23S rRNA (uracil(1939)-C(5))-methyltransferase RlmD [Gammaproteobacteria bacterium]|nr:23S rRNA (uracil(1939)-C(5))-methyltransferase RlmD [Gammaproteobacteria bacterium]
MGKRRRKPLPEPAVGRIESLSPEGRGVTRVEGKTVFVSGALPGETVRFEYRRSSRRYDEAEAIDIIEASPDRVEPACPHFGTCGGCSLQHLSAAAQIRLKERALLDNLKHLGKVEAETIYAPLTGPAWGYRRKARLGVRYVHKKGRVLIGFRERFSRYLADMSVCPVLCPEVGENLGSLAELIAGLSIRERIPQIEVAQGDNATALVIRHLDPLIEGDRRQLIDWGEKYGIWMYLQAAGPDSVTRLSPGEGELSYHIDQGDIDITFLPSDFTQVNPVINQQMIGRALEELAPEGEDHVVEFFAGLGNFTLPLARRAGRVTAIEGETGLVDRARANATNNGLVNIDFHVADLSAVDMGENWQAALADCNQVLLDPPRSGALALLPAIAQGGATRLLYISCNPATLARDAGELVHRHGYRLKKAGVMDMFPHTAHVESMALFEK